MNQVNDKKLERKSLLRVAVILYLSLAFAAVVATVAWFSMNTNVFVQNEYPGDIQIEVSAGDLQISRDPKNFGDKLVIRNDVTKYKIDISGDGEKLYFPKSLDIDDEPFLGDAETFVDVTGNDVYYIETKVYFRTTSKMDVYLSKDSYVSGLENLINESGVNAYSRRSLYGIFSCDAIVGAARVAFLSVEGTDAKGNDILQLRNVWVPNDDIKLSYDDEGIAQLQIDKKYRESIEGYSYLALSADENYMVEKHYTSDDYAKGVMTVGNEQLANPTTVMSNQAVPLISFEKENVLQTKAMVIRVWFEGTDREADKALNGGMVKYKFDFVGIQKDEAEYEFAESDYVLNEIVPEGQVGIYYNTELSALAYSDFHEVFQTKNAPKVLANEIIYSFDGINWSAYNPTSASVLTRKAESYYIFIRSAETLSKKPGNIVKVLIPAKSTKA